MLGFLDWWSLELFDRQSFNNVVKTIVNEYHWFPDKIESLYLDNIDMYGITFWYDNILEMHEKLKSEK